MKNSIVAGVSAVIGIFVKVNYKIAIILIALMFLDILIGTLFALMNGEFESSKMKEGLVTKMLIFLLCLSLLLFLDLLADVGMEVPFMNTFGIAFCFNEMFSILEKFAKYDVLIPKSIMKWFKVANDKLNNEK